MQCTIEVQPLLQNKTHLENLSQPARSLRELQHMQQGLLYPTFNPVHLTTQRQAMPLA